MSRLPSLSAAIQMPADELPWRSLLSAASAELDTQPPAAFPSLRKVVEHDTALEHEDASLLVLLHLNHPERIPFILIRSG